MAALHAAIVLALAAPHAAAAGKVCSITDHAYGGSPSSKDNALAIQAAIADCSAGGGGGTVVVPAGHGAFATGPVVVAGQGIVLRLESGAELVAAYGPEDWPLAPKGEGRPAAAAAAAADGQGSGSYIDFLTFSNCSGCGLVGDGTIFGKCCLVCQPQLLRASAVAAPSSTDLLCLLLLLTVSLLLRQGRAPPGWE